VRVLAALSVVLAAIVVLEGRTVRAARAEVQALRAEREQAKTDVASTWARQSAGDLTEAIRWLDDFYAEPSEGFGRDRGLCAGGAINSGAIVDDVIGGYVRARAAGAPKQVAIEAMKTAIQRSDAYRAVHPDQANAK
jgi:hypothetical protein